MAPWNKSHILYVLLSEVDISLLYTEGKRCKMVLKVVSEDLSDHSS